jgi:hypothetical protein
MWRTTSGLGCTAACSSRPSTTTILDNNEQYCLYRQITKLGPLRLSQQLRLARTVDGPLGNKVPAGQFTGRTISFDVRPAAPDSDRTHVEKT